MLQVLNNREHELDGKKIDPKVAFPKRTQAKVGGIDNLFSFDDEERFSFAPYTNTNNQTNSQQRNDNRRKVQI